MLVYVATPETIDQAFTRWIDLTGDRDRRVAHQIYRWFMASDQAKIFSAASGLVSFSLNHWLSVFQSWIDQEISVHPSNADNIRAWSDLLVSLLSSDWGIEQKLIVAECLDEQDH